MKFDWKARLAQRPEWRWSLLLFLIAFALYARTIGFDYAWDDDIVIRYNSRVQQGFSGIPSHFQFKARENFEDFTGFRPIALTSLSIDIGLFGLNAWGGHLMNVLYFGLLVVVLFRTLRLLFPNFHAAFAFFISLLFLVHPLRVEVVANIKSRDEILALLFSLLALQYFVRHYREGKWLHLGLSALMLVLGALSKENALTFLAVLPLSILFLEQGNWKRKTVGILKFPIIALIVALIFLIFTGFLPGTPTPVQTEGYFESLTLGNCMAIKFPSTWEHLGNSLHLFWLNVKKFLWPTDLVYFSGYNQIRIVNWTADRVLLGSLFVLTWLGWILPLVFFKKLRILGFGFWYFSLTISIYLQLPGFLIADTIADRFMLMPSIGLSLILVWGIFHLLQIPLEENAPTSYDKIQIAMRQFFKGKALVVSLSLLMLALIWAGMAFDRSKVWKDNLSLFGGDLPKLEECSRAHYYYANTLMTGFESAQNQSKIKEEVVEHLRKSFEITPQAYYSYLRLMEYSIFQFKDFAIAEAVGDSALIHYKQQADLWHYRGMARYYQDKFKSAASDLKIALDLRPKSEDTREFLGRSLDRSGQYQEAIIVLNEGIATNPDYLFYYDVQSDVYWDQGDTLKSFQMIEQLIAKDGQNADWWKKIIGRHQLAGNQQAAAEYYNLARSRGVLP